VAWWSLGYGTGEQPGNVVLAAHVDWGGRLRVFGQLHRLGPGDAVIVHDELAREYRYEVVWSKSVRAEGAPVEEIFAQGETPTITLITCGGTYVPARREYLDRLIVRAVGA
jgi:LPXTG-site transpeptidase (sortase) family protein